MPGDSRIPAAPLPALAALVAALAVACAGDDDPRGAPTTRVTSPLAGPTATAPPTSTSTPTPSTPTPTRAAPGDADTGSSGGAADTGGPRADAPLRLDLREVADGLSNPLQIVPRPGDGALLVVEQPGRVRVLAGGRARGWLDLSDRVLSGGERGLLSIAFHPEFPRDNRLFVHYSGQPDGRTVLSSIPVVDGRPRRGRETVLLEREQPAANHNGGMLRFGPDGRLYLGLGDGGAAGDRFGNGQDPGTLLGAILRLDVSEPGRLAAPPDNPFVGGGGHRLVWHYGLRNPWRFTFDDGWLYIADVGQDAIEEVDVRRAGVGGLNFGWPVLEGSRCFRQASCDRSGLVPPTLEYSHADTEGCAVIGGPVYRGRALPGLRGHYLYGDLCAGFLRSARIVDGRVVDRRDWTGQTGRVRGLLGFGSDRSGEVHLGTRDGRVLRLVPR